MPLFQKPATTPEEVERSRPLDIPPEAVAELDEEQWYQRVYRGDDVPQLTVRAVVMGSVLGFFLSFTNIYIGLKAGWGVPVAITACILSFSIWNSFLRARLVRSPMSILETNCMQSTASAAGYSTGNGITTAIPALLLLTVTPALPGGQHLPWPILAAWTFVIAVLGVALAIPMKRNLINHERLRFPSGIAAAVTLQTLFSAGGNAVKKGRALLYTALVAGMTPLLMDVRVRRGPDGRQPLLPAESAALDFLPARGVDAQTGAALEPSSWTMVLDHKLVMIGAGMIVGLRVSISLVVGGLLLAYVVGPAALEAGAARSAGTAWREIGLWVGAPILVSSGLVAFALQWRTIARAFRGLGGGGGAGPGGVEVPIGWFYWMTAAGGIGAVTLGQLFFHIPWPLGVLALLLTFVLSLVAARATGETDITPVGPMGKLMQLTYGVLIPQNAIANVATAAITANSAASSADLLIDLKSGYLLGASPRRQFVAQALGIFTGTLGSVLAFHLLVPDATALTGVGGRAPEFPAPGAQAWLAVARVFEQGFATLHPMARQAMIWGVVIGAALALIDGLAPKTRRFLPSATGVGFGLILPFQYPLSFLIGATIAWVWQRRNQAHAERYVVPVSSGVIAGESIVGVAAAALNNFVLR